MVNAIQPLRGQATANTGRYGQCETLLLSMCSEVHWHCRYTSRPRLIMKVSYRRAPVGTLVSWYAECY